MLKLDLDVARHYILGKQGLWPGRRWRGLRGTQQAMRTMEYLQLDPLQIVARTHDIKLYGRVLDYDPGMWADLTYKKRKFFDWGGWLAVRPMNELPYWLTVMRREREGRQRWSRMPELARQHSAAIAEVRALLRKRGTIRNRDFEMADRARTQSYRGRKDSSLALYYLWYTGEVMTHHREGFERVYALTKDVAPKEFIYEADEDETDRFLVMKEVSFWGLGRPGALDTFLRGLPHGKAYKAVVDSLVKEGEIMQVQVPGWKGVYNALASDIKLFEELAAGRVPNVWKPLDTTTAEEAVFIAPWDHTVARGRAKVTFDFKYTLEVYKPAPQRKYGYYTQPILWGEKFVGRIDSKLDRATNIYVILGLWLDDKAIGRNRPFADALQRGFARYANFLGAERVNAAAIREPLLRKAVASIKLTRSKSGQRAVK
jgi:uncharacterized protein YcaQ